MHHCVGTQECYFDRISRKTSYIVFLRRQEELEKEFYTMEIEPDGNIVQKVRTITERERSMKRQNHFKEMEKECIEKIRNQEKILQKRRLHYGLRSFLLLIRIMW